MTFSINRAKAEKSKDPRSDVKIPFIFMDSHYQFLIKDFASNALKAGDNLVLDFKNTINLENKLPTTENPITKITQIGLSLFAITAKNIIFNANNINISSNLQSDNDLSIMAGQNININNAQLTANQSQSLIANDDINLNQANVTTKDSSIIAKNGSIQYTLNPLSAFKDNVLSQPILNASNSLNIQAGKNITFDNIQLGKTNKLTLGANENILIRRHELNLIKLMISEQVENVNALIKK